MIFKYKGIDKKGKKVISQIEASSLEEAKKKLKNKGINYFYVKKVVSFKFDFNKSRSISNEVLATLLRDLGIYLKSGISLVKAITLASNQYKNNKRVYLFLQSVKESIEEGNTLYYALEHQNIIKLPSFLKQAIKVSENSGILDEVLQELYKYIKSQDKINKQIQGAMAYPMFIFVVSIFVVSFMMGYIVPKIVSIFTQMHQTLPTITQIVITISNFIKNNYVDILIGLLVILIIFFLLLKKSEKFRYLFDKFLLKLPFIGNLIESFELGRFAYMSSVLLRSGMPFVQSIKLSANILNNLVLKKTFEEAIQKVVEGEKLSVVLAKNDRFSVEDSFIQAMALGEETSEVTVILDNLSQLYFERNKDKLDVFLSLLEPFLMLVVGGVIGFIITAMLLPIFSLSIK